MISHMMSVYTCSEGPQRTQGAQWRQGAFQTGQGQSSGEAQIRVGLLKKKDKCSTAEIGLFFLLWFLLSFGVLVL